MPLASVTIVLPSLRRSRASSSKELGAPSRCAARAHVSAASGSSAISAALVPSRRSSVVPSISASAALTRRKVPSMLTSAMPLGESRKACPSRSASASSRSVMSRATMWHRPAAASMLARTSAQRTSPRGRTIRSRNSSTATWAIPAASANSCCTRSLSAASSSSHIELPVTADPSRPSSSSAAGLARRIVPSRAVITRASLASSNSRRSIASLELWSSFSGTFSVSRTRPPAPLGGEETTRFEGTYRHPGTQDMSPWERLVTAPDGGKAALGGQHRACAGRPASVRGR